jgi:HAD superfamily hydrolase (TIGR01509 family)
MQAIFFDFDGVIVESADIKVDAFSELYKDQSPEVIAQVVAYHKSYEGISRVVKILCAHKQFLGIDLTEFDHDVLCQKYSQIVEQKVVECESVDGALEFLIKSEGQMKRFVVSGTPEYELRRITNQRGINMFFEGIYGSPRSKEDIVNEVLNDHGFSPDQCLFIGDAMTDHDAAKACGMPFLGRVAPGQKSPFPKATQIVPDLSTLGEIVTA